MANQNKKKDRVKVYLTKYNLIKLSDADIEILKESKDGLYEHHPNGRYFRCTDYLPQD